MPLTIAPGRVKASFMEAAKAMANTMEIPAGMVPVLAPIGATRRALHPADPRNDVLLIRNEVMQEALGGRTWLGALSNAADSVFADLAVHIRFHDRDGRSMGAPVSARAARLGPGDELHLQARLPAGATGLRIQALRWTRRGRAADAPSSAARALRGPSAPFRTEGSHRAGLLPRRGTG